MLESQYLFIFHLHAIFSGMCFYYFIPEIELPRTLPADSKKDPLDYTEKAKSVTLSTFFRQYKSKKKTKKNIAHKSTPHITEQLQPVLATEENKTQMKIIDSMVSNIM